MAGSKTRFGFAGGSEPPDEEESRAATTVCGRDVHLQVPPGFVPHPPPAPIAARPPTPMVVPAIPIARVPFPIERDEETAERPLRPRPSRLARFLGQWTPSGRFESRSRMGNRASGIRGEDLDALDVPRDTATRNVVVVLLVAAVAFGLTFAVVKLRQRGSGAPTALPAASPAPAPLAAPAPAPVAAPTAAAPIIAPPGLAPPIAPPAKPSVAATPTPPSTQHAPGTSPAPRQSPKGAAPSPPAGRRAPPAAPYRAEPPQHLKGELLPLQP